MNILIPPGQSWLRIELLSPANFGSSGGRATLDRPVAVDPWTGLPYLPFSALSGVLAGQLGDVYLDRDKTKLNVKRTTFFGTPDDQRTDVAGKPGALVFGDGELLSFPVPLANGGVAHVVPLSTAAWLRRIGFLSQISTLGVDDLRALTLLNGLPAEVGADGDSSIVPALLAAVAPLIGQPPETIIVAAPAAAKIFWRCAAEVRTMTALERKRVRGGSLRRVELIPAGSILLSLVTSQFGNPISLDNDRVQLGAWEAWGCGYARARVFLSAPAPGQQPSAAAPPAHDEQRPRRSDDLMIQAFKAVKAIEGAGLRAKVRSLLRETGPRIRMQGIASTLAFSLAKAKLGAAKRNDERDAHRWMLRTLFGVTDVREAAVNAITGQRAAPDLEEFCQWLSRYAGVESEPPTSAEEKQ